MNIAKRIKKVRQILNKSQQELADEVGITKQAISNIETGKSSASLTLLSKLYVDYNVNLNYIICGEGAMFVDSEATSNSLRKTILEEVEKILDERGVV